MNTYTLSVLKIKHKNEPIKSHDRNVIINQHNQWNV